MCLILLNENSLVQNEIDFGFLSEEDMCFEIEKKFYTGDFVYTAGFPMGLAGDNSNYPIVRSGIISRLDDECMSQNYFYIDNFSFPGNSGGPVFSKPEVYSIGKAKPVKEQILLGIVSGYVPYEEILINQQTGKRQSILTQNSGLTKVVPIKAAKEIYTNQAQT